MNTIDIVKSEDVGLYYIYFNRGEHSRLKVQTIISNSTNINVDYLPHSKKIFGVELLSGLKYIDQSINNKTVKLEEDTDYLYIHFTKTEKKEDQEMFRNDIFENELLFYSIDNNIVKIKVEKDSIFRNKQNSKYNLLIKKY